MLLTDLLVGVVLLVGLAGIVVPVLPGSVLILGGALVWAMVASSPTGWVVFGIVAVLLVVGGVVKYAVPGRRLSTAGIPRRTLLIGGVAAVVGFFVIPVVGLIVGFVAGVYLSELQRVGSDLAWPATTATLRAVGLSVLIELVAGLLAVLAWLVGVFLL